MVFFPYRADLEQWRFPIVTLLISVACIIIYAHQYEKKTTLDYELITYCNSALVDNELRLSMQNITNVTGLQPASICMYMLKMAHLSYTPENVVKEWAFFSRTQLSDDELVTREYINENFQRTYKDFSINAPYPLTQKMMFSPKRINVINMVTSIFAHTDIMHLVGNLFFFFAFAATVEMVIGSISMVATVLLLAILTNIFYAGISFLDGVYISTLGLSGVVFGMMGMFASFLPRAGIRCFAWFIIYKRFVMPAWLLVSGYVLWNIADWFVRGDNSSVNFIVHISGALFGYLIGMTIFRISKEKYTTATTVRNINRKYAYASR